MAPPLLPIEFVKCWLKAPTEIQFHIIQQLLLDLQSPPARAEEDFLKDNPFSPDPHPPSFDQTIKLARGLNAIRHLEPLGSSAAVPLAKFRALW